MIERGYCRMKQSRGLATRYDKLAIVYRAAVVLNRVLAWLRYLRAPLKVLHAVVEYQGLVARRLSQA